MRRPGRTRASLPLLGQPWFQGSRWAGDVLPRAAQCSRVLGCAGDFPVCRLGQGKLVAGGHPHLLLFIVRLLAEEEEKLKQLMKLKEEQEEYIIKTQREKQVLKQEMENKNKCLEEAQKQLEEVRVNRQRVDQDVMVSIMSVPHLFTR